MANTDMYLSVYIYLNIYIDIYLTYIYIYIYIEGNIYSTSNGRTLWPSRVFPELYNFLITYVHTL